MKDDEGNVREEEVSVEQYYFQMYSYTLKYPNLPALDVGNKKKHTFIHKRWNLSHYHSHIFVSMCVYVYICVHICVCIYVYSI